MSKFESFIGAEQGEQITGVLSKEERELIFTKANLRKRSQEFKIDALNLKLPETSQAHREKYERTLSLVKREADGAEVVSSEFAEQFLENQAPAILERAIAMEEIAPGLSEYLYAVVAKHKQVVGQNFQQDLDEVERIHIQTTKIPKVSLASMLPDAILIGIQKREVSKLSMPPMEKIARAVLQDEELLRNYALALEEGQREKFLSLLPPDEQRRIAILLDSTVSQILHAALVEKGTPEEEQRRQVRIRLFKELRSALSNPETTDKILAKELGKALGELGEDSRQLLLELIRDEYELRKVSQEVETRPDHLPRVMKVMLDNFDDWRANDIIMRMAADIRLNQRLAIYLFGKLVERGYISKDVKEWWDERKTQAKNKGISLKDEKYRLSILRAVAGELGVVPGRQAIEFVSDDQRWKKQGKILGLPERIEIIRESQAKFAGVKNNLELCSILAGDEDKAITYFLLYGGQDRFNLINNYDFSKFYEMVSLIGNPRFAENKGLSSLKIHEKPIKNFHQALAAGGIETKQADLIIERLRTGHFPLLNNEQAYQEVSFEISENAALNNANDEIGKVMGREQLGVIFLFPMFREYLEQDNSDTARKLLSEMQSKTTFIERLDLITKINKHFPSFQEKAKADLQETWVKFGEKMLIDLTLDQVITSDSVPIKGEELLPRFDAKRIDLKRISKELLALLRGENKAISDLSREISRKKKARAGLAQGLEKQAGQERKQELQRKIDNIDADVTELETRMASLGEVRADDRFAHLSPEERRIEFDRLSREVIALTEKSPSAIFTYIATQVLGEERLRESDIVLIRELESHLQGPFQTVSDLLTYDKGRSGEKKQARVGLQYLDKTDRLMTMVRFADSKICCFSSNNYEMKVKHDVPNKFWVASINADPMSFVVSMELPRSQAVEEGQTRQAKENIGFIFGNFGLDEGGQLALFLNGVYYAPGIENERQVETILASIEKMFRGLPIKEIAVATQYGGAVKMPDSYTNDLIELTRLRAIDDGGGRPETKIYDDLGVSINKPHSYGDNVWHKFIK